MEDKIQNVRQAVEKLQIFSHEPAHQLTQVYGFIKSSENIRDATTPLPQYIRLSLDTKAETVVKFMYKGWNLPKPDMIISVTGGAKNYDAWLITAGTNIGVAKEVGEAVNYCRYNNRKHGLDVPCIGIASWGYTAGNKQLDNQSTHSLMNTSDTTTIRSPSKPSQNQRAQIVPMDNKDRYIREYIVKENQPRECYLEPNHTHFLLFDDGQRKAETILPLQAEIGKYSRNIHLANTTDEPVESLIPIVMVLVDGGSSSIRAICEALKCGTPVVVIKHSGRAADLVAELHACYSDREIGNDGVTSAHPTKSQTDIVKGGSKEKMIEHILTSAKERSEIKSLDGVKNDLCNTLDLYKDLVTIFEFDGTRHRGNLEDAFLESLSNARKSSRASNEQYSLAKELKLAIAWHKFYYAQTCLRTDTTISKLKQDDLRPVLVEALYHGHTDCVKLLIEFGTSLEKLTHGDLEELYTKSTNHQLSSKDMSRKDQYYLDCFAPIVNSMNKINNLSQLNHNAPLGETAPEDLFLWAVFFDRFELAIYLCSKIWNISLALLCGAYIYRRAASKTNHTDIKQRYEEHADRFDTGAASIINLCFDDDEQFALDLLRRSAVAFKHITPLDLVKDAECKSFLASKCVQRHLDNIWYGHIDYKRTAINFKIFVCSLCFPLLPIFCFCLNYIKKPKNSALNTQDDLTASPLTTTHNVLQSVQYKRKNNVSYVDRIIYFYNAPIVRFYYHTIFFIVFLGLFSFVLLVDYFPLNIYNERRSGFKNLQIPITEIILHICIWSLIVEEIYQVLSVKLIKQYLSDKWNMIDIIAIMLYLIGFITRFIVLETVFAISKKVLIFMCLDLICWFVRILHLFAAFQKLGPKLIMIFNMMKDLFFFVCFILIFLLAFSITSWSLITTDNQVSWYYSSNGSLSNVTVANGGSDLWTWHILRHVANYGVWKIFGQVESINGMDAYSYVAFILDILFVVIANVLLLSVLVALFNVTIQNVEKQSYQIWGYQRYLLVAEYSIKSPLPPPFNTFHNLYRIVQCLIEKLQKPKSTNSKNNSHALEMESRGLNENNSEEEFKDNNEFQRKKEIAGDYWWYTLKHEKENQIVDALQNIELKPHDLRERIHNNNQI
ncbi:unnamed protein product [Rotaria sordida]|uniref:Uncharacterized protein n=1 Tax=Rotaria sordida TaxID=392033 RepID=A0A814SCT7_9BILA|nr:unnamed protein product [Rotaria sordida]